MFLLFMFLFFLLQELKKNSESEFCNTYLIHTAKTKTTIKTQANFARNSKLSQNSRKFPKKYPSTSNFLVKFHQMICMNEVARGCS